MLPLIPIVKTDRGTPRNCLPALPKRAWDVTVWRLGVEGCVGRQGHRSDVQRERDKGAIDQATLPIPQMTMARTTRLECLTSTLRRAKGTRCIETGLDWLRTGGQEK